MKKRHVARIIAITIALLTFFSLPEMVQIAEASPTIWYRITYRVTVRTKKKTKKPKLSKSKLTFTKGEIRSIRLLNATSKKVKWYSSNKKVATVKKDGKWCDIRGKKPGKAVIYAKYKGRTYKCKVTVKKKKSTAFTCWTNKNGETLYFKSDGWSPSTYLKEEKRWFMYNAKEDTYYGDCEMFFKSSLYPLTLTAHVDDTSVAEIKWDDYDDDLGWHLIIYPQGEGYTELTITNSYNKQRMTFGIDVTDNYVPPDERYFYVEKDEYQIDHYGDVEIIKVFASRDVSDVNGYFYGYSNDAECEIVKKEQDGDCFLFYVMAKKNGRSRMWFRDADSKHSSIETLVIADMSSSTNTSDTGQSNTDVDDPPSPQGTQGILESGKCGDNCTYELDKDGILTIKGSGEMSSSPWKDGNNYGLIKKVVIENGVTKINQWAFKDCQSLTGAAIPASVKSIDMGAFDGCSSLTDVELSEGLLEVGTDIFSGCTSLKSVIIPSSLRCIYKAMFSGCTGLESVTIKEGVKAIDGWAFSGCTGLKSLCFPESMEVCYADALEGCSNLTSIFIPESMSGWLTADSQVFNYCPALTDVYFAGSEEEWDTAHFSYFDVSFPPNVTIRYNCTLEQWNSAHP